MILPDGTTVELRSADRFPILLKTCPPGTFDTKRFGSSFDPECLASQQVLDSEVILGETLLSGLPFLLTVGPNDDPSGLDLAVQARRFPVAPQEGWHYDRYTLRVQPVSGKSIQLWTQDRSMKFVPIKTQITLDLPIGPVRLEVFTEADAGLRFLELRGPNVERDLVLVEAARRSRRVRGLQRIPD